jgi:phage-related protein
VSGTVNGAVNNVPALPVPVPGIASVQDQVTGTVAGVANTVTGTVSGLPSTVTGTVGNVTGTVSGVTNQLNNALSGLLGGTSANGSASVSAGGGLLGLSLGF